LTWKPISGLGCWRRGLQQRAQFLQDFAQGDVVDQQGLIYFREAPENGGIGGDVLAHFDKGADNIDAHGHGARLASIRVH
jgi:hypothetical protein